MGHGIRWGKKKEEQRNEETEVERVRQSESEDYRRARRKARRAEIER
jgi:hypothetical protein